MQKGRQKPSDPNLKLDPHFLDGLKLLEPKYC